MNKLKEKVALITGSRQGLGYAIAKSFLDEGAKVIINGRNQKEIDVVAGQLRKEGLDNVIGIEADVRNQIECFSMVEKIINKWGRVDILVNNATDSIVLNSEDVSSADWDKTIHTNLSGSFYCSQAVAKLSMLKNKSGSIIMISSVLGLGGSRQRAAYCAAKHGVIGLAEALAVEWALSNIRVNTICPSNIMTPLEMEDALTGRCGYTTEDIEHRTPMGRYSTPEEQARACVWLASDDSSFTTGSIIKTDGGWSAYMGW
ncbi:TPA: short-chain dehydrogenase [Candidatus Falkowbacteria bacterium]|nr:short-chain dehydrogenase [Candidatus Falkowbacteria bacterium]